MSACIAGTMCAYICNSVHPDMPILQAAIFSQNERSLYRELIYTHIF